MTMIEAAKAGDDNKVARLLAQGGCDLEAWDECGRTAIYCAAMSGELCCVEMLADAGASLRSRNSLGIFPGQAAAMNGHRDVLVEFLKRDLLFHCDEIMAPVMIGSSLLNGRLECADEALMACRSCMGEQRSYADEAAIYMCKNAEKDDAAAWGAALGWLKKNGLKRDLAGALGERMDGRMILALAKQGCFEGMREMIRWDAKEGGGLARSIKVGHGSRKESSGAWPLGMEYSLLCAAAECKKPGARQACEAALEFLDWDCLGGVGIGSEMNPSMEAARCAALAGNEEIARWLDALSPVMLGGAKKSKRAKILGVEGRFIHEMVERQPEILARLLGSSKLPIQKEEDAQHLAWWGIYKGSGALLEQALALRPKRAFWKRGPDRRDDVLLVLAAYEGRSLRALEVMLDRGADPDAKNVEGVPAVVLAACGGHVEMVEALAKAGADLEARGPGGDCALISASAWGRLGCVRALVDAGARLDARDRNGWSPAMRAARAGSVECFEELMLCGASFEEYDGEGITCVNLALESQNEKLAALAQAWSIGVETRAGKAGTSGRARL